jgi:hypothetical protein
MSDYDHLLEFIGELDIIDSHEHLPMEADRPKNTDVLAEWLMHYFSCDLVSAGLSRDKLAFAVDSSKPLAKRWKAVEPYWQAARSTGYGRSLDIAARGLYGVDGVTGKTIGALNEAFVAARRKGGHYQYVLKEKSRIALSIVDSNLDCDRRFFASAFRPDAFICVRHREELRRQGEAVGLSVHSLDDWQQVAERHLDRAIKKGAVALKCGLAYLRTLHFQKAARADAENEFRRLFHEDHSPAWRTGAELGKAFQDYMMHSVLAMADKRGLAFQFHTGIQEGSGNVISDANPVLLTNLFLEYENVRFDIFHMGYPYCMELSNLAKNFRNVFIDMCWGHIISPEAARRALVEWLDAVPANKITAFGGDYCFVDGIYGHQEIARRNVAAALAQKVADGSFDLDRARQIAKMVFVENPTALFNLAARVREARKTRQARSPSA